MRIGVIRSLVMALVASVMAGCGDDGGGDSGKDLVARGDEIFQANCAACHGADLRGTETGPSLLNEIYAPDHHPDASFYAAVANGVQPHHWDFGPMPPQPALNEDDVRAIIAYVRSEQENAGISGDRED
jgi:mono/diheme cytochrome c family protein